jgi:hypothetical protein
MGKTNKQFRAIDEKQHHVSKAIKKEASDKSVKYIDKALRNKRYEVFYDELDLVREEEHWDER